MSDSENNHSVEQISAVAELLKKEGISETIQHDPYKPLKQQGQSDEDAVRSFVDAAESLRDRQNRNPSTSVESRYEPQDEGGEIDQPAGPPPRYQTPQDVAQAANWLASEVQKVESAFQNYQISRGQYEAALAQANQMATEIHGAHIGLREQQLAARDRVEGLHRQIAELVPEWGDPHSRAKVQGQMKNFLTDYGLPPELLGEIQHPQAIAAIHSLMKDVQGLKVQRNRQLEQIRKNTRSAKANLRRENSVITDPNKQTAAVTDLLRSAGVF